MKIRQDAWTEENDLLLAETVLRHVREGSTQLNAFEEVGDILDRTSAACGFRWNAVVRYNYEKALQISKKFRKEKLRHAKGEEAKKKLLYTPSQSTFLETDLSSDLDKYLNDEVDFDFNMEMDNESIPFDTNEETNEEAEIAEVIEAPAYTQAVTVQPSFNQPTTTFTKKASITMFDVIQFLQSLSTNNIASDRLQKENEQLKRDILSLQHQNQELLKKVNQLEKDATTVQEDYETMMKIMNRARKLVLFEEEEKPVATSFRMDKNGNLEKIAE
ncbi:RsfA family transcriptional regulator [Bacillus sp. RG28]|uniref:RsfA family transcriptional regulator n=1 Tax=Gottfriedia endophytica TaxID=2820819 RepID=A0A940NGJ0_9BACI|nr:RsfA family transcriptional regulator [Gottfriedia endophytica]MBP0725004.1 RsfA family transcriptional regulator [Gottfriedia endophytica]